MSDEEEKYDEEEEEEIAAEDAPPEEQEAEAEAEEEPEPEPEPPKPQEKPKPRPKPLPVDEGDTMTEAEKAMLAAKQKHKEEEEKKLEEFEAQREIERQKQEEELEALKEKQQARKAEREEMERELAERKEADEEARLRDEEVTAARKEAEKAKVETQKKKRQQAMEGALLAGVPGKKGRNFEIVKKPKSELPGEENKERSKATLTKEEYDQMKAQFMLNACRPLDLKSRDLHGLRDLIKTMHKRIESLEMKKYDLDNRNRTQDYDIRELNERRKQSERQKALAKGLDPEEAVNSPHPPKIQISSKFDRQIDRRPYVERQQIYQNPRLPPKKKLCRGTGRPPPEFGRPASNIEELELLRKNMEPPKYVEESHMEGAKAPVKPKALQVPGADEVEEEKPAPAPAAEVKAEE